MRRKLLVVALGSMALIALIGPAAKAKPGFVFPPICCFYNGQVVRTVVPPASFPNIGTDPFYAVVGGADGQLGVVGVAPGAAGYHGGHWAVFVVTWNVAPYLLTSRDAVSTAAAAGDVTVTRDPSKDFLCPIQF